MFDTDEASRVIVLGKSAADGLFPDGNVIGQKVTINATEFTVIGTLAKPSSTSSSVFGSSLDTFNLIPFGQATVMNKNQVKIMRILAKASDSANVKTKKTDIHNLLLSLRNGEENFTVLTQDDLLGLFDQFINLATSLVSAIATISLVVGGIGIMNIMLVTVTERTREIGLRIAVGATKGAILVQFLTEAVVITLMGGLIGLGISVVVARIISFKTPLHPVFSIQVVLATVAISVVIGVIFGIWPALRAAGKDPIEALRYE
jgi:putative ABC transport system permease protein